jgi:hypothetical protein
MINLLLSYLVSFPTFKLMSNGTGAASLSTGSLRASSNQCHTMEASVMTGWRIVTQLEMRGPTFTSLAVERYSISMRPGAIQQRTSSEFTTL